MLYFAILVSRDGQSWLLQRAYAGTTIFDSAAKAREHIESIRCPDVEFKVLRLGAEVVE